MPSKLSLSQRPTHNPALPRPPCNSFTSQACSRDTSDKEAIFDRAREVPIPAVEGSRPTAPREAHAHVALFGQQQQQGCTPAITPALLASQLDAAARKAVAHGTGLCRARQPRRKGYETGKEAVYTSSAQHPAAGVATQVSRSLSVSNAAIARHPPHRLNTLWKHSRRACDRRVVSSLSVVAGAARIRAF